MAIDAIEMDRFVWWRRNGAGIDFNAPLSRDGVQTEWTRLKRSSILAEIYTLAGQVCARLMEYGRAASSARHSTASSWNFLTTATSPLGYRY